VSPAPKAGMIDRYTTGVLDYGIVNQTFSLWRNAIIPMHVRTIRIAFTAVILQGEKGRRNNYFFCL
jgi:hypothetical protein